jgi:predicted transcriptional regulator
MPKTGRPRVHAPVSRTYVSPAPQHQVKLRPIDKRVKVRHNLRTISPSRQQTLTQMIDFAECVEPISDESEDNLYNMRDRNGNSKRRRTGNYEPSSTRHYTQTLTQLDFFSDPSDELRDGSGNNKFTRNQRVCSSAEIAGATAGNPATEHRNAPKTPLKSRQYEVPSSQSPATPLSTQGRLFEPTLPLAERNTNSLIDASPIRGRIGQELPVPDAENKYGIVEDSQERIPSTPAKEFVTAKPLAVPEPCVKIEPSQKRIKLEIVDSEEETDDEPGVYNNDFTPEAQAKAKTPPSTPKPQMLPISSRIEAIEQEIQSRSLNDWRQRVSIDDIELLGERSDKSDIIISIHPKYVADIVSRAKDHEFRTYMIPNQVKRMWIYETAPSSSIKYMASISTAKKPGQISDLRGIGNREFNMGGLGYHYAYEIFQVYTLTDPLPLATLKAKGWIKGPPQKYLYVQPTILDRLLSNLEYSLFGGPLEQSGICIGVPPNDTQEAEFQPQSTAAQLAQPHSLPAASDHPRPSQATTASISYTSSPPPGLQTVGSQTPVRSERVTLTNTAVVPDTPSHKRSSSVPYALPPQQVAGDDSQAQDMPMPLPFTSSQLLTRSQMLPDSLINDELPPPPLFIEDSDFDE